MIHLQELGRGRDFRRCLPRHSLGQWPSSREGNWSGGWRCIIGGLGSMWRVGHRWDVVIQRGAFNLHDSAPHCRLQLLLWRDRFVVVSFLHIIPHDFLLNRVVMSLLKWQRWWRAQSQAAPPSRTFRGWFSTLWRWCESIDPCPGTSSG